MCSVFHLLVLGHVDGLLEFHGYRGSGFDVFNLFCINYRTVGNQLDAERTCGKAPYVFYRSGYIERLACGDCLRCCHFYGIEVVVRHIHKLHIVDEAVDEAIGVITYDELYGFAGIFVEVYNLFGPEIVGVVAVVDGLHNFPFTFAHNYDFKFCKVGFCNLPCVE